MPKDYSTVGLWYNKTLFDKAGVKYPDDTWTWDDLANAAAKLTDKSKGQYGIVADNDANYYEALEFQNEAQILTNADGTKATANEPAAVDAMTFAYSFIQKGESPSLADQASTKPDDWFTSGKAAMIFNGSWMPATYVEAMKTNGQKFDVSVLPKGKTNASPSTGLGYSIASNTKYKDAAVKFLEYMGGEEANTIQAKDQTAIPAYLGTEKAIVDAWPQINFQAFIDSSAYGVAPNFSAPAWSQLRPIEQDSIANILGGKISVKDGMKQMNDQLQQAIDDYEG
jgi:multiple sugar transport system substrate-binding protein